MANWNWPAAALEGGVDGSAMSKLFRGGELSDTALLAREAIQNSSDAHDEFKGAHPGVPFRIVFRFVEMKGEEKTRFVNAMDLKAMRTRRQVYRELAKDPLQPGNVLDHLDEHSTPIRLLFVEDYGTHGLYGHPRIGTRSHLFKAMYYIGASTKGADEGGLYGFGKSALQRASRTNTVAALSTFEPFESDPVKSRLIGFTWWRDLQEGDVLTSGRGCFASGFLEDGRTPAPFEDDEALAIASELGFRARKSDESSQLGTSFLILDPAIQPRELCSEIEKWWWPALEEHKLDVRVVQSEPEEEFVPKPNSNVFVSTFLKPYRLATGVDRPSDPSRERVPSENWRSRDGIDAGNLGSLGLVLTELTNDDALDEKDTQSQVALMRSPRMVVNYTAISTGQVVLRGAFVASEDTNVLLRETEPSTHDRWNGNLAADVPEDSTKAAKAVESRIKNAVRKMAKEVIPPPPRVRRKLSTFAKLMKDFIGDKPGPHPPIPSGGERIELVFPDGRPTPVVADGERLRLSSRFAVRVADNAAGDSCEVSVDCELFVLEDDNGRRGERWPLRLSPEVGGDSDSFVEDEDGSWRGVISKSKRAYFTVASDPYPNLWTVQIKPEVVRLGEWVSE